MKSKKPAATGAQVGPWPGPQRIAAIDALRGFALLGILLVNVLGFSGIRAVGVEAEGLDRIVEGLLRIFAQGKFLSLFAILFGVSFSLQLASLRRQGAGLFPTWWRRSACFGCGGSSSGRWSGYGGWRRTGGSFPCARKRHESMGQVLSLSRCLSFGGDRPLTHSPK
jgi:hypothetical protein